MSEIHDITCLDHAPVSITLRESHAPGPAFLCRANSQVFESPQYASHIEDSLREFFMMNAGSVSDPSMVWCAHKAFIRGIIIKLCAHLKRQRALWLDQLLSEIRLLEPLNKSNPSSSIAHKLSKLRSDLRDLLIEQQDKYFRALKLSHYSAGNKAGKFLANRLKARRVKNKIAYLLDPVTNSKIMNLQEIADSFARYYSSLYNLKDDPTTPQLTAHSIDGFLASDNLPLLTPIQLQGLNAPITQS